MKRMIDNKEFDAIVKDVNELKQEAIDIPKAKDKGIYFALEEPTENTGVYTYALTTIGNINTDIPLKVGDLIMSFDSTDLENVKSSNMWRIDEIGEDSVEVVLVGKVGESGGKTLYQHNIHLRNTTSGSDAEIYLNIITDSDTQFTLQTLINWLYDNNFYYGNSAHYRNSYVSNGYRRYDGTLHQVCGIQSDTNKTYLYIVGTLSGVITSFDSFTDTIIAL